MHLSSVESLKHRHFVLVVFSVLVFNYHLLRLCPLSLPVAGEDEVRLGGPAQPNS